MCDYFIAMLRPALMLALVALPCLQVRLHSLLCVTECARLKYRLPIGRFALKNQPRCFLCLLKIRFASSVTEIRTRACWRLKDTNIVVRHEVACFQLIATASTCCTTLPVKCLVGIPNPLYRFLSRHRSRLSWSPMEV